MEIKTFLNRCLVLLSSTIYNNDMQKPFLSVVIPAYREEGNVKRGVLKTVRDYLQTQNYTWEVVVVDDGSPDNTALEIEKRIGKYKNFRLMKEKHRGKGGTVIAGVLAARGEVILFTDMDQATPLLEIEKFLPHFAAGADVVIGSRAGRPGEPFLRQVMAYGFLFLRTAILRLPYRDTQCGFKAFTASAAQKIFRNMKIFTAESTGMTGVTAAFDLELLYIARKMNLNVIEVPVTWEHVGSVRVNPIKDSWLGLKGLMEVRLNAIRGVYKIKK